MQADFPFVALANSWAMAAALFLGLRFGGFRLCLLRLSNLGFDFFQVRRPGINARKQRGGFS